MELEAKLEALAEKVRSHSEVLETEEAAKFALVNPFISALGYDLSNPAEVTPEFTCDYGGRKGEKVDYAIKVGAEVAILVECKSAKSDLSLRHASQLCRYFGASDAKFAILTNGAVYKFYSDLDATNRMDDAPFLELDIRDLRKSDIKAVARFQKTEFDRDAAAEAAANLQMASSVGAAIEKELLEPSDQFVRMIAAHVTDRRLTPGVKAIVARHIPVAFKALVRDKLDARWSSAMSSEPDEEPADTSEIETTPDELEGYNIVRAIAAELVAVDRIAMRDSQSYCAVLLDDNNRKPIARLRFNSPTTRYIGTFDADKNEELRSVEQPSDIFRYKDAILNRIRAMEQQ